MEIKRRPSIKFALLVCLVTWGYARFGLPNSKIMQQGREQIMNQINSLTTVVREVPEKQDGTGSPETFSSPVSFVVNPGQRYQRANVRVGPGRSYRVAYEVPRGGIVMGLERVRASNGDTWIRVAGRGGFVKETILLKNERFNQK